jgi:hypothetical protein
VPELSPVQISLVLAGAATFVVYCVFILAPAWGSYGRTWERLAASFLTLFILASLLGIGIVIGGAIVWTYDRWA